MRRMASLVDRAKDAIKSISDTYKSGDQESSGIGKELAAKKQMMDEGKKALTGDTPATPATPAASPSSGQVINSKAQYGDRPGEKRIDVSDMVKPLVKYHKGTSYVPKTGPAILKKGEAVIPAEKNPMNTVNPFDLINKGDKKPKKEISEIRTKRAHDGKMIHTHIHHHPETHPDETHVSSNMDDMHAHMENHMGTPNDGEAAAGADAPAPMTAAPSPMAPPMPTPGA